MSVVIKNRFGNEIETTEEIALAMVGRGEAEIVAYPESAEASPKKKVAKKAPVAVEETETTEESPVTE